MSCGDCNAGSFYPKPNDRSGSGPGMRAVNASSVRRQRAATSPGGGSGSGSSSSSSGYRRFYSSRLARISDRIASIVAEPSSLQFRDAAMAALAVYALYRGVSMVREIHTLLVRTPVAQTCFGGQISALFCAAVYLLSVLWIVGERAVDVGMWLMAGAVAVFFAEEVIGRVLPRKA